MRRKNHSTKNKTSVSAKHIIYIVEDKRIVARGKKLTPTPVLLPYRDEKNTMFCTDRASLLLYYYFSFLSKKKTIQNNLFSLN